MFCRPHHLAVLQYAETHSAHNARLHFVVPHKIHCIQIAMMPCEAFLTVVLLDLLQAQIGCDPQQGRYLPKIYRLGSKPYSKMYHP